MAIVGFCVGVDDTYALIPVTYPAGSTCTCVNSSTSTTFTAEGTSGSYAFAIPFPGTWTVSCTSGYNTSSRDVNITHEGQAESVTLSYTVYLYNTGVERVSFTTDIYAVTHTTQGTFRETGAEWWLTISGTYCSVYRETTNKIDLTNYSTLHATGYKYGEQSSLAVLVVAPVHQPHGATTALANFTGTNGEITIDLRGITGEYYIGAGAAVVSSTAQTTLAVSKIWLTA